MYKRTIIAVLESPPPLGSHMCKAMFGKAKYRKDVAFCIPVEIDSTGAYCITTYEEK